MPLGATPVMRTGKVVSRGFGDYVAGGKLVRRSTCFSNNVGREFRCYFQAGGFEGKAVGVGDYGSAEGITVGR